MRRYLFLILFAIVLAAPFLLRALVSTDKPAAASGDAARLVVITPHNQDIRREFAYAFDAWHRATYGRAVTIDYRNPGGTNDIKRQLDTTYRRYRNADGTLPADVPAEVDLVWGGGDYFFDTELNKQFGLLQPMSLDPTLLAEAFPKPNLGGVKLYDPNTDAAGRLAPRWVGVALSAFGIVYNADLFRTLGLPPPKTWRDLTNPKLAGLIALADPTHSGSAGVAYLMVVQREMATAEEQFLASQPTAEGGKPPPLTKELKATPEYQAAIAVGWKRGMGILTLMAANARYFTDSAPLVPNDVGNGEAAAGIAIDFYGRVYQESVGADRCTFLPPVNATAITPDPVAILVGVRGERLQLATRFVEFLLTREGQLLWNVKPGAPGGPASRALRRPPIRADLYALGADRSNWTDDTNPFAEAGLFNQRGEWMPGFTDTRSLWAATWIDARDALKDAHARILSVKDESRRAALLAELADVPIERKELADVAKRRAQVDKNRVDEWNAKRRLEWAERFRADYRAVGEKAR